MVLAALAGMSTIVIVIMIGVALAAAVAHILALIDSIRDKNWIWLAILMLVPGLGTLLYWLFGNER